MVDKLKDKLALWFLRKALAYYTKEFYRHSDLMVKYAEKAKEVENILKDVEIQK